MGFSTTVTRHTAAARKGPSKKEVRLSEIYSIAARVLHERGYDATSLLDVARAVGLTKAGLYHYITTKEELLFGVMNYGMDLVQTDVIEPTRAIADPVERLREIVARYAQLILEKGQAITLVINEANGLTTAHRRKVSARRRAFYEYVREAVSQIKVAGRAPVLDVSVTALSFFGVLMWMANWYRDDGRLTREEIIKQIKELTCERMLGLPKSKKGRAKNARRK